MVLGFILYEAVDFVWHFGKLTWDGIKYVYNCIMKYLQMMK